MKRLKKILKGILITLVVLIVVLFTAPYIFKNKIVALVKKEINKNLTAKVDFKDVDISFFRHFPKVAIGLDDLQVIGTEMFEGDTLMTTKRLDASVNIMSIIRGKDMTIYSLIAESPRVHAVVNKEGFANWDIVKPSPPSSDTSEAKPFKLELKSYEVRNAFISYDDEQGGMSSTINGLDHKGSGDFTSDQFTLKTSTDAASFSLVSGGVPFFADTKTSIDADVEVNNKNGTYSFNTDDIRLNDLKVSGKGLIKTVGDSAYDMDISFKAPSTDFKNILSLVPSIYQKEFSKVKANGNAIFSGFLKGIYSSTQMPAYNLDMEVKDASFQYTDLPKPVKDINFTGKLSNADGKPDNMVIDIRNGHINIDNEPFDFRFLVQHPSTDMYVDAAAKGKLDLSKVSQFMKLDKDTKLSGLLNADVNVKGNVSAIEAQQYDRFSAGGIVNLSNFLYADKDYPTGVRINTLASDFTPSKVNITTLNGQYLSSNFSANGYINNLLSYLLKDRPLSATLSVSADKVNLNDWMGTSSDTATAKSSAAAQPFVVPANLNVNLATKVSSLHYDKFDLSGLSGNLLINDETVSLKDMAGNALDGTMKVNGSYSTKESKRKPAIALQYDVAGIDVQKAFYAFNTVQKLMPIGKYLAGKLTSRLDMKGLIGENMMPDLASLTGNGNLLLLQGILSKFAPLDKIASTLQVKALENISLKDIKNYFEFTNGKMLIKPFNVNLGNIGMEIGGLQGFDQSMDYVINMKLPRSLMGNSANQMVNDLISKVNSKGIPITAGETVNLKLGLGGTFKAPTVKVDLKGTAENITDQLKTQVTDFVKAKLDSAKTVVKDTIAAIKKQALEKAKEELLKKLSKPKANTTVDSTPVNNNPADTVKQQQPAPANKPKDPVKNILKDLFNKTKTTGVKDSAKQ